MSKPSPIQVTVTSTQTITPNMQRITLSGDGLSRFPNDCEGGYIKLMFNELGGTDLTTLEQGKRPTMRTYTIREFNPNVPSIEVDFVRHNTVDLQCGFAARWAMNVEEGETITIGGPGLIQGLNKDADWFFLAADMTSLPALSAKVKSLPRDAKGYAVIQIASEQDKQPLDAPSQLEVIWLIESEQASSLSDKVQELTWLEGTAAVWTACEFENMRALRQYFRNEKEVAKENIYISSYWKRGVSEDGHKVLKQEDAKAQAEA